MVIVVLAERSWENLNCENVEDIYQYDIARVAAAEQTESLMAIMA